MPIVFTKKSQTNKTGHINFPIMVEAENYFYVFEVTSSIIRT